VDKSDECVVCGAKKVCGNEYTVGLGECHICLFVCLLILDVDFVVAM
jgi:hypothetical protein